MHRNNTIQELNEAAIQEILKGSPISTVLVERDRVVYANRSAEELLAPNSGGLYNRPFKAIMDEMSIKRVSPHPLEMVMESYEHNDRQLVVICLGEAAQSSYLIENMLDLQELIEQNILERTTHLQAALAREKELNAMKSNFVSVVSHEFRTPLSAILSSVCLIEQYCEAEQAKLRKKHVDRIKSSVRTLSELLDEFLSLEKLEQGKIIVRKQHFDLNELMLEVIEYVSDLLKPGQVILYSFKGQGTVFQDGKILRNILINLLSNASKYSSESQEIILMAGADAGGISIEVTDRGIGIPEEDQKDLFSKFYRAGNALHIQGTGLGLNIVKSYVELLGGVISFNSKKDAGTSFFVLLNTRLCPKSIG